MGDWMTVNIIGSCDADELGALGRACRAGTGECADLDDDSGYGPLCIDDITGLCGLGDWVAESMCAVGNCYERNFSPESVASQLEHLVKAAPSLRLKVHCGGAYESKECVKTVTVEDGHVSLGDPEIKRLPKLSDDAMIGRFMKATQRR